jgi:hypothetical protein
MKFYKLILNFIYCFKFVVNFKEGWLLDEVAMIMAPHEVYMRQGIKIFLRPFHQLVMTVEFHALITFIL